MIRFATILFMLVAFACGGDEGQAPGGAAGGAGEEGERAAAVDPNVQGCLDLVRAQRYAEAIAPCTEALRGAPENREVQMALEEARTGAAEAVAEARREAEQAAEEATSQLEEARKEGLTELPPSGGLQPRP